MTVAGTTKLSRKLTFGYSRIRVPVTARWSVTGGRTSAKTLTVNGLAKGARVTLACHGRGCPFARRTFTARGKRLALASKLSGRLATGATVTLEVTLANRVGEVIVYTTRSHRTPASTHSCLVPGARRPSACVR